MKWLKDDLPWVGKSRYYSSVEKKGRTHFLDKIHHIYNKNVKLK